MYRVHVLVDRAHSGAEIDHTLAAQGLPVEDTDLMKLQLPGPISLLQGAT